MLMADNGYDANVLRSSANVEPGPTSRPRAIGRTPICFSRHLNRDRNRIERFFNKTKQFRRIATRYDKLAENFLQASSSYASGSGYTVMSRWPKARRRRPTIASTAGAKPALRCFGAATREASTNFPHIGM